MSPFIPHYPQGLKETPAKGTGTPITWEQTDTLWAGDIDKHEMGSNAVRKVMVDGKLVPAKYKKSSRNAARLTFRKIREHFNAVWKDNLVPVLRQANKVMAFLRDISRKTEVQVERDQTVQDSAEGAVAGRDADDDDEVDSGAISRAAKVIRARDKSSELKDIKTSYTNMLGHIISTFKVWSLFAESLGTDALQQYEGTFDEGQLGFKQAKQANNEAAANRTKNALQAIPSLKLLFSYLPKSRTNLAPPHQPTSRACSRFVFLG